MSLGQAGPASSSGFRAYGKPGCAGADGVCPFGESGVVGECAWYGAEPVQHRRRNDVGERESVEAGVWRGSELFCHAREARSLSLDHLGNAVGLGRRGEEAGSDA